MIPSQCGKPQAKDLRYAKDKTMTKKMETDQFAEFVAAVVRSVPRDMDATTAQGWIRNQSGLEKVLRAALVPPTRKPHPSDAIAAKYGYTVVDGQDAEPTIGTNIASLELVPFLKSSDNGRVNGEELRKRAIDLKANPGLVDAEYVHEHQAEIPVKFRDYYLVFTGTLLRDQSGNLSVACLCWTCARWVLFFRWVGHGFSGSSRLVRCE